MTRHAFVIASLAALLGTTQVYAQTQPSECKGEIAKAEGIIAAMADQPLKQEAVNELTKAKDMAAANNEKQCLVHMQNIRERLLKERKALEGE